MMISDVLLARAMAAVDGADETEKTEEAEEEEEDEGGIILCSKARMLIDLSLAFYSSPLSAPPTLPVRQRRGVGGC